MEWSKLKTIILLILLTLNLFLLVLVGVRQWERHRYRADALDQAVAVFARNGITLADSLLEGQESLPPLTMERDRSAEVAWATALLGDTVETAQGGSSVYTGPRGTLRISRTGEFSASFATGALPLGEDAPADHGREILARLGFEGRVLSVDVSSRRTAVTFLQLWEGAPVFSCTATLLYEDGGLTAILEGSRRLTGAPTAADLTPLPIVTALLRFVDGLGELGDVCTTIAALERGYFVVSGLSDPAALTPLWQVTTDTHVYHLDGLTGAVTRVA